MGFFGRGKQDKALNRATPADSLVARLISNDEPTFLGALLEADLVSQRGDYESIRAIREAIRIRSGKDTVNFKESKDSSAYPVLDIMRLAKRRALLSDPGVSCGHIENLVYRHRFDPDQIKVSSGHITNPDYWSEGGVLGELLEKIVKARGPSAGHDFRLLCYEIAIRMKLMDACTRTGNWDEFFRLSDPSQQTNAD